MSKKCNKVKNPCKICLGPVTQKTGLQCQGACKCWVHYVCLNYTPGKIKDIKAGIIKVTCPCPDCKTSQPKEYRTDTAYSCNNSMCPANRPPKCENHECPSNEPKPMPQATQGLCSQPCPLSKCAKNDCKQYSSPHLDQRTPQVSIPPRKLDPCNAATPKCPSGCSSLNDMSGDFGNYQERRPIDTVSAAGGISQSMDVVEQMCNTVGELANQIQQLMSQMRKAVNDNQGPGTQAPCPPPPCPKPVQQPKCPKPCFCPGNPCQRSQ